MTIQTKKAPADLTRQQGAYVKRQDKHIMKIVIFQVGIGFLFGFCTTIMIEVLKQRTGTVGGEILLLPMMVGIAVAMYHVGRDCR